jgi:hypothetical protein
LQEIFVIFQTGMPYNLVASRDYIHLMFWEEIVLCRDWSLSQCVAPYTFSEIYICRKFYIWLTQEISIFGICCEEEQ